MRRFLVLVSFVSLVSVVVRAPAGAQDAPVGLPVTPDPSLCTVAPRTIEGIYALVGTPVPGTGEEEPTGATPAATVTPVVLPTGEPADAAVAAAITTTVVDAYACFNAGDYLRAFALYSDDAIRRFAADQPFTEDVAAFFQATPEAFPADLRSSVLGVREARILPDGRVGALVDTNDPTSPPDGTDVDFVVFVKQGDRYLIDEELTDLEGSPAAGTPTA